MTDHLLALAVAFLALLAWLLARGRYRGPRSPAWALLRVVFPSWRFFEDVSPVPELFVRTGCDADALGPFTPLLKPPARGLLALVWNPRGNLHLAYGSMLERLTSDLAEAEIDDFDRARKLVSYRLVERLVRNTLRTSFATDTVFQLKLRYGAPVAEDVLISDVVRLGP